MVYHQKLVACIKVDGKVLRELDDTVTLPFGAEYSILIKNLNSLRVQVKVSVDGTDATEGTWLIIQPNSSIELERFIKNANLNSGNKFKFIARTKSVEEYRGLKAEDGLIRIEYQTEKALPKIEETHTHHYDHYHPDPWDSSTWPRPRIPYPPYYSPIRIGSASIAGTGAGASASAPRRNLRSASLGSKTKGLQKMAFSMQEQQVVDDSGITVPGGVSEQKFQWASGFQTEKGTEVVVLKLRGEVAGKKVTKPMTVKTKPTCQSCGQKNQPSAKFCTNCGTGLVIV